MKSDTQSGLEQPLALREKRSINPWLLIFGPTIGGLMLITAVLFVIVRLTPEQPLGDNERLMPDGTILKIEGVTWGNNHSVSMDDPSVPAWKVWDRRQVAIADNIQLRSVLKIWMTRRDRRSGRLLNFDWWGGSSVTNSLGIEVSDYAPHYLIVGPEGTGISKSHQRPFRASDPDRNARWLVNSSFPAFRTDNGKFPLRVKNTSGEIVATFDLIHPQPQPVKNWQAEELPATKSDGDLTVTLHGLQRESWRDPANGTKRWHISPVTTVTENGLPTNDWYFGMSLEDPFRNNLSMLGTTVSAGEPVWRVHLSGWRRKNAEFPASETWMLADVPVLPMDTSKILTDTHTIDGVTVTLTALAGAGNVSYSIAMPTANRWQGNPDPSQSVRIFDSSPKLETELSGSTNKLNVEAEWPHIAFEVTGDTQGQNVLIKARDDQGREVLTQHYPGLGALRTRILFFKTEPNAKTLTLAIIVHRPRKFEFFIKPPEFIEEKPMP